MKNIIHSPGNLVELNVNPCKMCMPMGAATALCGIKNCMSILHGSQGCATYIRRHMATHYNEPVDIASSSLTEHGTVFGGEENLIKGLHNLIELYHPDVIGICTTCLAETIGEDIDAIAQRFAKENPDMGVKLITIPSPGYGGTQNEGFFRVLRALVEQIEPQTAPNGKINIITPLISPADTRWLKGFLTSCGIDFILLPDISDNLDGVTAARYNRLKSGGTPLSDIAEMAGARLTLEFSEFLKDEDSPGDFLRKQFGVPLIRLPLPTGIRAMDLLCRRIREANGKPPDTLFSERGRYLDAMVDSHKYCAKARVTVFGEPDFVKSMVSLCYENGILPLVVATGSIYPELREIVLQESKQYTNLSFESDPIVLDDCDFNQIESACRERDVNIMIGSSDGRRTCHNLGIELIRCAFPIHDRIGGGRVRTLGFDGSLSILDQIANTMLKQNEEHFRDELYEALYQPIRKCP